MPGAGVVGWPAVARSAGIRGNDAWTARRYGDGCRGTVERVVRPERLELPAFWFVANSSLNQNGLFVSLTNLETHSNPHNEISAGVCVAAPSSNMAYGCRPR